MNKGSIKLIMFFGAFTLVILIVAISCSTKSITRPSPIANKPLDKETFTLKPFGYEPTIKNFRVYLPSSFKLQVYSMKNIHNPSVIDTIYRFHQSKSEFFIYKNVNNREMFFAGNIYTTKIKLNNGVKVGMDRSEFYKCFTNMKTSTRDTIRVSTKRATNSINFIFKKNKLDVIKIDNYID